MNYRFLFSIVALLLLAGCGIAPKTEPLPSRFITAEEYRAVDAYVALWRYPDQYPVIHRMGPLAAPLDKEGREVRVCAALGIPDLNVLYFTIQRNPVLSTFIVEFTLRDGRVLRTKRLEREAAKDCWLL